MGGDRAHSGGRIPELRDLELWNRRRAQARRRRGWKQRLRLGVLLAAGMRYPKRPGRTGPANVLVIRPDHLGDVLFATPAIRLLRQGFPTARLTALVGPWSLPVVAHNPDLDEVLPLPFPGFSRESRHSALGRYSQLRESARWLRDRRFDTALVMRSDHWWGAWLAAEAGIPMRLGYAVPETKPFLTEPVPLPSEGVLLHEVERNLTLARTFLGRMQDDASRRPPLVYVLPPGIVAPLPADEGSFVAIHPGAGAAVKLWSIEGWAQVGNSLRHRFQVRIIMTGSAAEKGLCNEIAARLDEPPINLAGLTSLDELAAVYQGCRLVLGTDSGPLHLAVAMGTPTVHLFGPADPAQFGPWGNEERHRVLMSPMACAPCRVLDWADLENHPCVRRLSAEAVIRAAEELLRLQDWRRRTSDLKSL